jgi:hypothetical protein
LFPQNLKRGGREQANQLVQVVPPHKAPAGFGYKGLEQVLDGDEPLVREHQAKFVRPVTEDVREHPG